MKLKKKNVVVLVVSILLITVSIMNPIKLISIYQLEKLNYSKETSKLIIKNGMKNDIISIPYSEFIDRCFSNVDFKYENLSYYKELNYYEDNHFLKDINSLIELKYNVIDINNILKNGDHDSNQYIINHEYIKDISKFLEFEYAKTINIDRYLDYKRSNVSNHQEAVLYVNIGLDKDYYEDYNEITSFNETILVNQYNMLSSSFEPSNLISFPLEYTKSGSEELGSKVMVDAFVKMADAIKLQENLSIYVDSDSAYRTYETQEKTYDFYLKAYGTNYAKNYVARPGFSEHQTGLAIDIKAGSSNIYDGTKESVWILKNAHKYGFIRRYEKDKASITGFKYEPWHYRYVGVSIATYIYEHNITYDEYYVMFIEK